MDQQQPITNPAPMPAPAPSRGMFGTGIPTNIAFLVAVLLFLMPFIDIKCNNMSLQTVTGLQLATGFKMKSDKSMFNDSKTDSTGDEKTDATTIKDTKSSDDKKPNIYAMAALGLGILGLLLSFVKAKAGLSGAMFTGVLGAAALIVMMVDIKKQVKLDMPKNTNTGTDEFSKGISDMTDKISISVDFTIWFYVAVIAFLAAAFFCYKRMQASKTA